jgi:hypothetical protein
VPALSTQLGRRARLRRLLPGLAIAIAHIAVLVWFVAPATDSGAQTPEAPQIDMTVSQSTGLVDGQVIDVTVSPRPGVRIDPNSRSHNVYICRPGIEYRTNSDTLPSQGNCPRFLSVSTSSLSSKPLYPLPDGTGARTAIPVGVGPVDWPLDNPTFHLTCDSANPCLLVAVARVSVNGGRVTDATATVELSYTDESPLAGCQPATAFLSAGSDRMLSWWTDLALAACGGSGRLTNNFAPLGEGEAVTAFAGGARDVAYTASGRTDLPGFNTPTERAAVYTPVGINAAVIAVVGGNPSYQDPAWPIGMPHPYENIRLTAEEAATLVGRTHSEFDARHGEAIRARNPELPPASIYWPGDTTKVPGPIAVQGPTSVTAFLTGYLDAQAPGEWQAHDGSGGFIERSAFSSFAATQPPIPAMTRVSTKSQLASLQNVTIQQSDAFPGPAWAITDYATAIELGLTPVAIENAAGEYVKPTPGSLAAAVPTMTVGPDGRRTPDVDTNATGAYPLTMIEYAMAPAEQLVDAACSPRTESQQQLQAWLEFVTGPGQQELPAGIVPLTTELRTEAQQAIARVGALPSTAAACAPTAPTQPTPWSPSSPGAVAASPLGDGFGPSGGLGPSGGFPSDLSDVSSGSSDAAAGATAPSTPDELAGANELAEAAKPTLPPFLGIRAVSEVISPTALLLLVAITALAAFTTSGRPLPVAVARAPGRAVGAVRRAARWRPGAGRG